MTLWEMFWRYGWAFALGLQLLGVWVSWSFSKGFVTHTYFASFTHGVDERFKQMEQRQADIESTQKQLVTALAALPTAKDMHRIEVSLTDIGGTVKASQAEVRGLANSVGRVERVMDMLTESHIGGK